jgi:hypothetical protein
MICGVCGRMCWSKDYCFDCARNEAIFQRISAGERFQLKLREDEKRDTSGAWSRLLSASAIWGDIFKRCFRW